MPLLFGNHKFVKKLYVCESVSDLCIDPFALFFRFHMHFVEYLSSSGWPTSLSTIISRSIHVAANRNISFFLWLSNIPWYIYHIFLSHSSVNGQVGCFHFLATVNSAAMNTGVHVTTSNFIFFPDIYPGVGLPNHMAPLFLVFWETYILFSIVAAPIYIPTSSVRGFPFLHTFSSIYLLKIFWWWLFWQCEVIPHCSSHLHFSNN